MVLTAGGVSGLAAKAKLLESSAGIRSSAVERISRANFIPVTSP